jgi:dihydrofolate reductase
MGSLILTMHTSADGFVATRDRELWPAFGWPPEAQAHLNDLYREAQAVIYGRHIYEMVVPFWTSIAQDGLPAGSPLGDADLEFARIMAPLPKYVVSHGFDPADDATTVIAAEDVGAIAGAADGPVLLLAGGALAGELARARVLAELFLLVGPIVLGSGRPLLDIPEPIPTRLLTAWAIPPGCTVMRYAVADEFPAQR